MYDSVDYHVVDAVASLARELGRAEVRIEQLEAEIEERFAGQVAEEGAKLDTPEPWEI